MVTPEAQPNSSTTPETARAIEIGSAITQYINSSEFGNRLKSENSRLAYQSDLGKFKAFCENRGISSLDQLRPENLRDWTTEMEKQGYKSRTIARKATVVNCFIKWNRTKGLLPPDFTVSLPKLRLPERSFRILTPEQVRALIAATKQQPNLRDAALVQIALKTGARETEIVNLTTDDIRLDSTDRMIVKCGTPEKQNNRMIRLDKEATTIVRNYLSKRNGGPNQPLFIQSRPWDHSVPLTRQGFWVILKKYGKRIGVPDLTPSTLRNTFAFNLIASQKELARTMGISEGRAVIISNLAKRAEQVLEPRFKSSFRSS